MPSRSVNARSREKKLGRPVTSLELAQELRQALSPWSGRHRIEVWSGYEKNDPLAAFYGQVYVKFAAVAPDSRVDEMHAPRSVFFVVHGPSHTPSTDFMLELARVTPARKLSDSERFTHGDADFVIGKVVEAIGKASEGRVLGRIGRASGNLRVEWKKSPLVYDRWPGVDRVQVVMENAPPPNPRDAYIAETSRKVFYGKNGRGLKVPRIEVTPGADPGVVAFIDFHEVGGPNYVYIDYAKTRQDMRSMGLSSRVLNALIDKYGTETTYNFGKVMHPAMWRLREKMAAAGFDVLGHRDF